MSDRCAGALPSEVAAYLAGLIDGEGTITLSRRHASSFTYGIANRQALALLREIEPYLRSCKRKRARLALENYLAVTPRNGKYSAALDAARTKFELDFLSLKAAGKRS